MEDTAYRAIAIVGAGAILPDAPNVPAFWKNIKTGRYSISEVTPDRWDPALYYDADHSAPDKTYSKIGGWVREYEWDPMKWRMAIPPRVVDAMDDAQKWAIACTREALEDYGYPKRPLDHRSHGRDPRQCHGRGEALSHRVAPSLSGIRPRIGGMRQFRRAAGGRAPRHHPRIAPSDRRALPRHHRRHHARRTGQLHRRPHRQYLQFPRPQLTCRCGLRIGHGGHQRGGRRAGARTISTWRSPAASTATWASPASSSSARSARSRRPARGPTPRAPTASSWAKARRSSC